MTVDEQWKVPAGYPNYEVSSQGRVRSWTRPGSPVRQSTPRLLCLTTRADGYVIVGLVPAHGPRRTVSVHRLIASAFLGPRETGMEIRHLDGNPSNNAASNLAYGTPSQNRRDRQWHGNDHNLNKVACPAGHAYDEANTYVKPTGGRQCRECNRIRSSARRARGRSVARSVA